MSELSPSSSEDTSEQEAQQNKQVGVTRPRRAPEIDAYINEFLSAVCDDSRRYILELLAAPTEEDLRSLPDSLPEMRSGDIARTIGLSPATTSEHLRHLTRCGLVTPRRVGNTVYYRLRNYHLVRAFHDLLDALNTDYKTYQIKRPVEDSESS
jgi:DNA-binding transcriptional ArsR family regulator